MSILKTIYLQHLNGANSNIILESDGDVTISGNVGIGTGASNSSKLSLRNSANNTYSSTAFLDGRTIELLSNSSSANDYSGIRFADPAGGRESFFGVVSTSLSAGSFVFQSYDGTSAYAERMRIDALGRVTTPLQPAFSASLSATWSAGSGVSTIPFASSNFNVGSCYNTSTYRFTAPIAGKYLFMCNLGSNSTTSTFTYFGVLVYVNGSQILAGWQSKALTSGSYICDSKTLMINLSLNDYVEFKLEISSAQGIATGVVCGQLIS